MTLDHAQGPGFQKHLFQSYRSTIYCFDSSLVVVNGPIYFVGYSLHESHA